MASVAGPSRALLIFVDGVGLGPADPATNPLAAAELPVLRGLLGGRAPVAAPAARPARAGTPAMAGTPATAGDGAASAVLLGLDARLGVDGLPQSGTGQTSLLAGVNGARLFGRHQGPWVPTPLRAMLRRDSLLARARDGGRDIAFANAYPAELLRDRPAGGRRGRGARMLHAGPPLAALGAGVLTRHADALRDGRAVASEIVNDGWRLRLGHTELPTPAPAEAGETLARIAAAHDLTLFAHYTTDLVGHRGTFEEAVSAIERVDAFLGGVLAGLSSDTLLVVASDHGNLEDVRAQHTLNPALALVAGAGSAAVARRLHSLVDVAPALLAALDVAWSPPSDLAEPQ